MCMLLWSVPIIKGDVKINFGELMFAVRIKVVFTPGTCVSQWRLVPAPRMLSPDSYTRSCSCTHLRPTQIILFPQTPSSNSPSHSNIMSFTPTSRDLQCGMLCDDAWYRGYKSCESQQGVPWAANTNHLNSSSHMHTCTHNWQYNTS